VPVSVPAIPTSPSSFSFPYSIRVSRSSALSIASLYLLFLNASSASLAISLNSLVFSRLEKVNSS